MQFAKKASILTIFGVYSSLCTVSGLGLLNVLGNPKIAWPLGLALFLGAFGLLILLFRLAEHPRVKTRAEIIKLNQQLIGDADNEVQSFSGDLSWIVSCLPVISEATKRNVSIKVLCRDPLTEEAKCFVRRILEAKGIELRYFAPAHDPQFRGMICDPGPYSRVLTVEKRHKTKGFSYDNARSLDSMQPKYDYWGQQYDAAEHLSVVAALQDLFRSTWELASEASLISPTSPDSTEQALRRIAQYGTASISLEVVSPRHLRPLHRFLNFDRYTAIDRLGVRLQRHQIAPFMPFEVTSLSSQRTIAPPIIELRGNDYIIIDGLHRSYWAREQGLDSIAVMLIRDVTHDLCGDPRDWDDIVLSESESKPKAENFMNFNASNWRDLRAVNLALAAPFDGKQLAEP